MFKAQITELSSTIKKFCSNHAKTTRHSGTLRSSICFSQATIAHEISEIHRNLMKIVEVWCNASLEMCDSFLPILKNSCYTTRGFRKACDHYTCCVNCRVNGNKSRKSHVNKNSKVDLSDQTSKMSRIFSRCIRSAQII